MSLRRELVRLEPGPFDQFVVSFYSLFSLFLSNECSLTKVEFEGNQGPEARDAPTLCNIK
jgi:hypothetical protein